MIRVISLTFFLLIASIGYSFVQIRIYIIPVNRTCNFVETQSMDYVRDNATYYIEINELWEANKFVEAERKIELNELGYADSSRCLSIVIDYWDTERNMVYNTIGIHPSKEMSMYSPGSGPLIYPLDEQFLDFINDYFPKVAGLNWFLDPPPSTLPND